MTIKVNDNVCILQEFNPIELYLDKSDIFDSARAAARLGFKKERISIQDRWFDVISPSELVRKRDKKDGYYEVTPKI